MHELGHNVGLQHGGDESVNLKPNYISVMNYSYDSYGIVVADAPGSVVPKSCTRDTDCGLRGLCGGLNLCVRVDYSGQRLLTLNEEDLDENVGVSGGSGNTDIVFYFVPGAELLGPAFGPIDWNANGIIEPHVQGDLDNDDWNVGHPSLLHGFNDWGYLHGILRAGGAPAGPRSVVIEGPVSRPRGSGTFSTP